MRPALRTALLPLAIAACGASDPAPTTVVEPPAAGDASLVPPAALFGIAATARGTACQGGPSREFDFWLGHWRVSPNGAPSIITSTLGGCAVLEEWIGGQGRSLNVHDRATGQWTQLYVFASGGVGDLAGTFRRDSMVLVDRLGPPGLSSVWVWTAITRDSVRQHQRMLRPDGTVAGQFDGRYGRVAPFTAPAVPPTPACQGAPFRTFDFLVGEWDVRAGSATTGGADGRLTVRTESNGCLIEERLSGAAGYAALAYTAYGPRETRWYRAFADDEGRYLLLTGTSDGTRAVLGGERPAAGGGTVRLRVTWAAAAAGRVTQRWESSRDGGATWSTDREYTLVKR